MKKGVPVQLIVAVAILLVGSAFLAAEYSLVKWYPHYQQRVTERTLRPVPVRDASLGVEVQVAAGIYGRVSSFPGGLRISHPKLWSVPPTLTITSQPNLDHSSEFSPQVLAKWETQGVYEQIPRYRFEHAKINNRDAVLIWQLKDRTMALTARVITPERIIVAECSTGREDESLFLQACESSLRTIKIAGPEPPPAPPRGVEEIASPAPSRPR